MVTDKQFLQVIDFTPLVSIDLLIKDSDDRIFLGKRTNRPAQDYWFVPGGRIRKNERIEQAIKRISQKELGCCFTLEDASLLGVYDHIYPDNYFDVEGINTHYVVLAFELHVDKGWRPRLDEQHCEIKAWHRDELLAHAEVHDNTKAYFSIAN